MGRACRCVNELSLTATNSSTALLTLTLTLALAVRPGDVLTQSVTYRPENNSYVLPRNPQAREQLVCLTLSLATVRRCAERGRKGRLAGCGPRLTDTHPRTHAPTPTPTTRTHHTQHATRNTLPPRGRRYDMFIASQQTGKSILWNYQLEAKQKVPETTAFIVVEHAPYVARLAMQAKRAPCPEA